jgi:bacteriocin-type transport-associated protein
MTDVLLKELSNHDINWMLAHGDAVAVSAETPLIAPGDAGDSFYILLDGAFSMRTAAPEQGARTAPVRLVPGELVGVLPGWELPIGATLQALKDSQALMIPRSALQQKLQDDPQFAAHLYRASAVLLAQRLEQQRSERGVAGSTGRESITVFAGLQDSDLDWLIAVGQVQQLPAQSVLVQPGRPADALHILLDGALSVAAVPDRQPIQPLLTTFGQPPSAPPVEFGRLSRGDLVGELLFVNACPPPITVTAVRDAQVLSVPRWRLATKLLYDAEFATRFYAVLCQLLAQQQNSLQNLGSGSGSGEPQPSDPLENQVLTQVALAEKRFDWMLDRIQSQSDRSPSSPSGHRTEIQW